MKKTIIISFLLAILCPYVVSSADELSYLSFIGIEGVSVEKTGDKVELRMTVDMSALKIRTQHTIALIPVIVSKDGTREVAFPPVVLDGKTRSKVYQRAQRFSSVALPPYHDGNALDIIRRDNGSPQEYDYFASVPYGRWMLDGRLELREEVHGCVNCEEGSSGIDLFSVLPEYRPEYRLGRIAPEPEPYKERAESRTARLDFRQDSYRIRPEYRNNRAELDSIRNSITMVREDPALEITGIFITGYASPEATEAYNLRLSGNRSNALREYIISNWDIAPELMHSEGRGEDWDGFVKGLDECYRLAGLDRIKALIAEYPGQNDLCESRIQALEPSDIYTRLLNEVYPPLRRIEYEIRYNVKSFNLDEARRIIVERPWLLSLEEIYMVAASYAKGSAEYIQAMDIAARYYPESPAVVNDRAVELITEGRNDAAANLLESFASLNEHAELLNTLGVALAGLHEWDRAEHSLELAVRLGTCEQASHNLEELRKVIDQQ